ncbi:hypothetical protein GCM10007981_14830 [Thermocladium modestius]|uniref:Uncharacterized protein n=1 Tax=Thermocladium modestius TaxID=62609 RepID=A0A830GZU1_9CREN|nr:hypothetical protein [Thermocladium modestius]GGP21751.1 hypothetical protein GCM10007981_14830 [Thermocladium modestius]
MQLPEPMDIKEDISKRIRLCGDDDVCIKMAVWFGNRLPAYLWSHLKDQLTGKGVSWQGMLSVFSNHVQNAARWAMGQAAWEDFIDGILKEIDTRYRTRSIMDYIK